MTILTSGKRGVNTAVAAGLMLVLALLAYSNSFNAGFQYDDYHQIVENQHIRDLRELPKFFVDAKVGSYHHYSKGYRPVTHASFALNYAVSGYSVPGFHLVNFIIHLLNAFLVYLIVAAVLKKRGREAALPAALLVSLVFALHPIQTQAVTYISGRAALFACLFMLAAFLCFQRFREEPGGRVRVLAALSPAFFLLALLSKEIAVGLIGIFAAYDMIFTLPSARKAGTVKKALLYYIPFIAVLALYLIIRKAVQGYAVIDEPAYGRVEYLMSELKALLLYVRLLLLPVNQNADYLFSSTKSFDVMVLVSSLLTASAFYGLYRVRVRRPEIAFFGLWFFIALAPESSLVPIPDIAEEYRLYLPSAGFIAALVLLAGDIVRLKAAKKAVAVTLIVLFGLLTFNRNKVWFSETTLWADVVKKKPESIRAKLNLGGSLVREKRYNEAIEQFGLALGMGPAPSQRAIIYNDLGTCYSQMGMMEEAREVLEMAVALDTAYKDALTNLGAVYYDTARYDEAIPILDRALKLDPQYVPARYNLALSYQKSGRLPDAVREMETALRYAPRDFLVNYNLAIIYEQADRYETALEQARRSLRLAGDPAQRKAAEELLARLERRG